MSRFPGAIYLANGRRLDRKGPDLTLGRIHGFEHRAIVSRPRPLTIIGEDIGVEVGRVWALADDADFEAIPSQVANDTVGYINGGAPLLLLGNHANVVGAVREMMLACILIGQGSIGRAALLTERCVYNCNPHEASR